MEKKRYALLLFLIRICFAFTFLWAFFDKLFGLGFTTPVEKSWLMGTSPTTGFLLNATKGPFSSFFHTLAGSPFVDWLFMLGLLLIGLALLFGVLMRLACYSGALLFLFMWLAVLPPEHNPLIDEHIVYLFTLLLLFHLQAGHSYGYGKQWNKLHFVKKYSWLE